MRTPKHPRTNDAPLTAFTEIALVAGIVILTAVVFFNSLGNSFLRSWDDSVYVTDNTLITNISAENILRIFSSFHASGNYHPLTLFSYALDYAFTQLDTRGYHITNLLLHCLNVILVYRFVKLLTGRFETAAITAAFFGIHPMHVESVSWISERKDVLYTFFLLGSLISYLLYRRRSVGQRVRDHRVYYALALLLFLLSLLSKSAAAPLPLLLLLVDFYDQGAVRSLKDKLPFFALSMIFGVVAILSQKAVGATSAPGLTGSPVERFYFASYGIIFYIVKAFVPLNLSAFYPYPAKISGWFPWEFYAAPGLVLVIAILLKRFRDRDILFGSLFFFLNIALVLQILPIGSAVVAERYTYLSYAGVFFIAGQLFCRLPKNPAILARSVAAVICAVVIAFSALTYSRNRVWKDGITLFSDVITKHPGAALAYLDRGISLGEVNRDAEALDDFSTAIKTSPELAAGYYNRGNTYQKLKKYGDALADYTKAVELQPDYAHAYNNRGVVRAFLRDYRNAIDDYSRAIEIRPDYAHAFNNRGIAFTNLRNFRSAVDDYTKAIELEGDYADAYFNRGVALIALQEGQAAKRDFSRVLMLRPRSAAVYTQMGNASFALRDFQDALKDYGFAISLDPKSAEAYYDRGVTEWTMKDPPSAIREFSRAIEIFPRYAAAYYGRFMALLSVKKFEEARNDLMRFYDISPNDTDMCIDLSSLSAHEGDFRSALKSLKGCIEHDPTRARSYADEGCYYDELGNRAEAVRAYKKSSQLDSRLWAPKLGLSLICFEEKNLDSARAFLRDAEEIEPRLKEGMGGISKLETEGFYRSESFKERMKNLFGSVH